MLSTLKLHLSLLKNTRAIKNLRQIAATVIGRAKKLNKDRWKQEIRMINRVKVILIAVQLIKKLVY